MKKIIVETTVKSNIVKIWSYWNDPKHIVHWAFPSNDWEAPHAGNDLKIGGKFLARMSAKDGSSAFDFSGTYTDIIPDKKIEYKTDDGRVVSVNFEIVDQDSIKITEEFEMENINSEEVQRGGWQAILNNFKQYVENN